MVFESPGAEPPVRAAAPSPAHRWTLVEDRDAVRLTVWGTVGPEQLGALDARLADLTRRAPLVVDLTGVTDLHAETVRWLGARHAQDGQDRPMCVVVVADGHVHRRLTREDAPQLRLTLE